MDTIRKMLLIFLGNTLVMLISWAGLSLMLFGIRIFTGPEAGLAKILSIHSYIVAMFCYAFYLIFDLCEYFSTQRRYERTKGQRSGESTKENLESKLLLRLVLTRTLKVVAICLALTLISWFLWLGKYTLGSFLAGAALGFSVFWVLSFLRRYLGCRQNKESLGGAEEIRSFADQEEIRPKATVED